MDHGKSGGHGSSSGMMMVVEAMRRQQELVMQLRALVLPLLHAVDDSSRPAAGLAAHLFDDIIGCNITVMSQLDEGCLLIGGSTAGDDRGDGPALDDKSLTSKKISSSTTTATGDRSSEGAAKHNTSTTVGQKRRRNDKRSRSIVTHVPHYDGYEWRKYGQKDIHGSQHPRSYYRCTYRSERNCLATKTIQQQEQSDGTGSSATAGEEMAKYTVVYYGDHSCSDNSRTSTVQLPQQLVNMDLQSAQMAQTTTNVQEFEEDLDLPALLEEFDNIYFH